MKRRTKRKGPIPYRPVRCPDCSGAGRIDGRWTCKRCCGDGNIYEPVPDSAEPTSEDGE